MVNTIRLVVKGMLTDIGRLSLLETELALRTLVLMVVLGTLMGGVAAACWLMISAALVFALMDQAAMSLGWAATVITGINIVLVIVGGLVVRKLNRRLALPATRRVLRSLSPDQSV